MEPIDAVFALSALAALGAAAALIQALRAERTARGAAECVMALSQLVSLQEEHVRERLAHHAALLSRPAGERREG